jgi:hypothetical protein
MVHSADIQDRDGGVLLLSTLFGMYRKRCSGALVPLRV